MMLGHIGDEHSHILANSKLNGPQNHIKSNA